MGRIWRIRGWGRYGGLEDVEDMEDWRMGMIWRIRGWG